MTFTPDADQAAEHDAWRASQARWLTVDPYLTAEDRRFLIQEG